MENIYNNLIEYSGVSKYIPKNLKCSNEITLNSNITIKSKLRDIKEIIKVTASINDIVHRVIKTPIGKSLEGQVLTGKKLIIDSELKIRADYITNKDSRIYCINKTIDFCTTLILDEIYINKINLIPCIFIEDIHAQVANEKEIFVITTILSSVEI